MNARQVCFGLAAAALTITVAVGGCSGDTVNNYQQGISTGDSGIDVIGALSTLGCTAGKKDCVNDTVARVCPSDGTAWVAVTCRAGEKCEGGDCKPIAGGPTAACVPGDGACLPGNKAIRCKGDGTGYEQFDCPANTACTNRGICMGSVAVGSSTCTGDVRGVNTFDDGFHATTAMCPANEYCVNIHTTAGGYPYNVAACKPAQCKPTAAGAICGEQTICGDPLNPANDQTKYVASCTATPEGYKWVGTVCPAGQTCNPSGSLCSTGTGGDTQAACFGPTCTEGTSRCAPDGTGIQTCGADGRWGASSPCNLSGGERCFVLPGTSGGVGQKAVCGDYACSFAGSGVCESATGKIRLCDANGKLQAASACAVGRCQSVQATGLPAPYDYTGRCVAECTPGQEACVNDGSYRTCDNSYRWGAPIACASPDGATTTCSTYSDPATSLAKHVCVTGSDCVPNTRRCVSSDGGSDLDQVQACGTDAKWLPAQTCNTGRCISGTCVMDCIPGSAVCDPAGSGMYFTCPSNGVLPNAPSYNQACPGGTACKRAGQRSFGCVQCVGPALTDAVGGVGVVTVAEARCLFADGGASGNHSLQGCKADNTWDVPIQCSSSTSSCVSTFNANGPFVEPGGVRSAYCD